MLRHQPALQTSRLRLRPFVADDAPAVSRLAGERRIADEAISIPHPYSLNSAKTWIASLPHLFRNGSAVHFAATLLDSRELIGSIALRDIDEDNRQAELVLWIGIPWWGQGYATEAALTVVDFGFEKLSLHRIFAKHLTRHLPPQRVFTKIGMKQEGLLKECVRKGEQYEDVALFAVLDHEWSRRATRGKDLP